MVAPAEAPVPQTLLAAFRCRIIPSPLRAHGRRSAVGQEEEAATPTLHILIVSVPRGVSSSIFVSTYSCNLSHSLLVGPTNQSATEWSNPYPSTLATRVVYPDTKGHCVWGWTIVSRAMVPVGERHWMDVECLSCMTRKRWSGLYTEPHSRI
jgi:hypothetical protein